MVRQVGRLSHHALQIVNGIWRWFGRMAHYSIYVMNGMWRRKEKNFFAFLGIALGISLFAGVLIGTASLEEGFKGFITHGLGEIDATITPTTSNTINESLARYLANQHANDPRILEISGRLQKTGTASVASKGLTKNSIPIMGIDPSSTTFGDLYDKDTDKKLNWNDLNQSNLEVFVGESLAEDLELREGNEFNVTITVQGVPKQYTMVAKAIYKDKGLGREGFASYILLPLRMLQDLTENGNKVISIIVINFNDDIVNTDEEIDHLMEDLKETAANDDSGFKTYGGVDRFQFQAIRHDTLKQVESFLELLRLMLQVFGSMIILAGAILILNIQLMTIDDRMKETGIRMAIGTRSGQIFLTSLMEFGAAGIVGGLLGIIGGIAYGWILVQMMGFFFQFPTEDIPLVVRFNEMLSSVMFGFSLALFAGIYPALRASRIRVVKVLRDMEEHARKKTGGNMSLYLGIGALIIGVAWLTSTGLNPVDTNTYKELTNAEALYTPVLFTLVGLSVLSSFFIPKNRSLTLAATLSIAWSLFNIFYIFNIIESGSGGTFYLIAIMLSLTVGIIILAAINLDHLATMLIKTLGTIKGIRSVALIAFRQMASQKTRSTLTFAIFATILTLNIFMATWGFSERQGFQREGVLLSGGIDVLIFAEQPINASLNYPSKLKQAFPEITDVRGVNAAVAGSPGTTGLVESFNLTDSSNFQRFNIFAIDNTTLWSNYNEKRMYPLLLRSEKLKSNETFTLEYDNEIEIVNTTDNLDPANIEEDELAWRALVDGATVNGKPVIIMRPFFKFTTEGPRPFGKPGMSIWLENNTGGYTEFVVIALTSSNPLFDANFGPSGFRINNAIFVNKDVARTLKAFNATAGGTSLDTYQYFITQTRYDFTDERNQDLARKIQKWSNVPGNGSTSFYDETGINFGVRAASSYEILSQRIEAEFRFFQFMQAFTSIGFLVGILGLLVVAVRSVSSRRREIGMMRAIGFTRKKVILAVLFELIVMGLLGLLLGIISGVILAWGLINVSSSGFIYFSIPIFDLLLYGSLTVLSALVAAIIPGYLAAKITPSNALRYVG